MQSDEDNSIDVASASFVPDTPALSGAVGGQSVALPTMDKGKKSKVKTSSGPRIATIHNRSKSDDEDDDESGQAFYAGGSERSGQQILGPPRKNASKDFVSEIFRCAQESGAQPVERQQPSSSSSASRAGPR